MRNPQRIDRILGKLRAHWYANPDQRLGQLVLNVSREWPMWPDVFNAEDDQFEAWLDERLSARAAEKERP